MDDSNISTRKEGSRSFMKDQLLQVSPFDSGEGLPYAPVDWPNAGDIWAWRVGGRFSKDGFSTDRFLIVPRRLQPSNKKARLALEGKPAVERYLRSNFPHADIGEFFASFTWKIPAKPQYWNSANTSRRARRLLQLDAKVVGEGMIQKHKAIRQRIRRSTMVGQFTTKYMDTIFELSSNSSGDEENMSDTTSSKDNHIKSHHGPENFDVYLNSLDDILAQPPPGYGYSSASSQLTEDMLQARARLSVILGMDLHALISSKDLVTEILTLSAKLQRDSSLHNSELSILKLIEEIPGSIKKFEENKKVAADADRFFTDMEINIVLATSYKSGYNKSRKKAALLQHKINSASLAIEGIDDKISRLQSLKAQKIVDIEKTTRDIDQLKAKQEMVISCMPNIVREVELAQLQRSEWELKKKTAADQQARILLEFAPLKDFSF